MPTSLKHDLKYRCEKVNRSCHTLEMRTNGTWHDIPNTNHLREKGGRKEGDLKEYITKWERFPKSTEHSRLAYIHMLASSPFLLALGRPCPNSMHPRSMCIHTKAKTRNHRQAMEGKRCKEA